MAPWLLDEEAVTDTVFVGRAPRALVELTGITCLIMCGLNVSDLVVLFLPESSWALNKLCNCCSEMGAARLFPGLWGSGIGVTAPT